MAPKKSNMAVHDLKGFDVEKDKAIRFGNEIWLDGFLTRRTLLGTIASVISFSLVPWLIAYFLCFFNGQAERFLSTGAFHVATLAISMVNLTIIYGSRNQYRIYRGVFECFKLGDTQVDTQVASVMARHSNFAQQFRAVLIVFVISLVAAVLGSFLWDWVEPISNALHTQLPRFEAFAKHGWYDDGNNTLGFLAIALFTPWIGISLGTSASIFIRMPLFFWEVQKQEVVLPPALIKSKFSAATDFYTVISVFWILGVFALLYFFGQNKDALSLIIVVVTFGFGIVNFFIPQFCYVRIVSSAEDRLLNESALAFARSEPARILGSDNAADGSQGVSAPGMMLLLRLAQHDNWVYPMHQTYIILGSYAIPIGLTLVNWEAIVQFAWS